jgi:methylated-DNA-[protein]-cysteine S-methyltransferase
MTAPISARTCWCHAPSPVGTLWLAGDQRGLCALLLPRQRGDARFAHLRDARQDAGAHAHALRALEAYFAGEHGALQAVALAPQGTPFQLRVWRALREVPAGHTRTYTQLAIGVQAPAGAARAVGAACARNPLSIFIPCHRALGARGALTGYAGGLDAKLWLLRHERAHEQLWPARTFEPAPPAHVGHP